MSSIQSIDECVTQKQSNVISDEERDSDVGSANDGSIISDETGNLNKSNDDEDIDQLKQIVLKMLKSEDEYSIWLVMHCDRQLFIHINTIKTKSNDANWFQWNEDNIIDLIFEEYYWLKDFVYHVSGLAAFVIPNNDEDHWQQFFDGLRAVFDCYRQCKTFDESKIGLYQRYLDRASKVIQYFIPGIKSEIQLK